jgi:hypothetical protein
VLLLMSVDVAASSVEYRNCVGGDGCNQHA